MENKKERRCEMCGEKVRGRYCSACGARMLSERDAFYAELRLRREDFRYCAEEGIEYSRYRERESAGFVQTKIPASTVPLADAAWKMAEQSRMHRCWPDVSEDPDGALREIETLAEQLYYSMMEAAGKVFAASEKESDRVVREQALAWYKEMEAHYARLPGEAYDAWTKSVDEQAIYRATCGLWRWEDWEHEEAIVEAYKWRCKELGKAGTEESA